MARFPTTEAEIMVLAQSLTTGLAANMATYPAPPVTTTDLALAAVAFETAKTDAVAAQAAAEAAVSAKNVALQTLVDGMKADLRYAETTVNFDDDLLKLLGWGGRASGTAMEAPGQTRMLEAVQQGEGWIYLDWKAPSDGGAVAAYKIQRRLRPDGSWSDVGMAIESEVTLTDQDRGQEWEYRVIAVNKTGEGLASNTVMAVL